MNPSKPQEHLCYISGNWHLTVGRSPSNRTACLHVHFPGYASPVSKASQDHCSIYSKALVASARSEMVHPVGSSYSRRPLDEKVAPAHQDLSASR
ncbi:hypothetical protein PCANC_09688 [Puccinia coronata f. sp. avenae]|uniref:Uncharacterized protein n=1 Tax=Puccinia coronata f. sp. avenae TaxID=200324 RepID=A0A2N5SVQ7_9BASI|nr:hypothetical protein PCANC_14155 [Puccinia coronata f. sp. avenae]PLW47122.1 hypothetical protein PCANC_09688 [Puccinia coronata f. sp. avenae]